MGTLKQLQPWKNFTSWYFLAQLFKFSLTEVKSDEASLLSNLNQH